MEMFVLSYVCFYPRLCLSSSQYALRFRTDKGLTNHIFYSYIVLLIYVNETIYLLGNLALFKIHVNSFIVWDDSPSANFEGPGATLCLGTPPFSN